MTRVNVGVPSIALADQHCFAEYREIRKEVNFIRHNQNMDDIPEVFDLSWVGHKRFFKNKVLYLYERFKDLRSELVNRNYNLSGVCDWTPDEDGLSDENRQMWIPEGYERDIVVSRITERVYEKNPPWYRYYGKIREPEFFVNLMMDNYGW